MALSKNLVCAIYNHPEAYPPTLNALGELSKIYDKIFLIYRANLPDLWKYPENVFLIKNGKEISVYQQGALNPVLKLLLFFSFSFSFLKSCYKYKPRTILFYDRIALLSFAIIRRFLNFRGIVWYHNHDVPEQNSIKMHSIEWWALRAEQSSFRYLDIFSLPANERMKFFDLTMFRGKFFFLPNFPSVSFYKKFKKSSKPTSVIKFIFQGSISSGHGIEEVMHFMERSNRDIKLFMIGNIEDKYRDYLISLSEKLDIESSVIIANPVNYGQLPSITASAHIGLAINKPENIIYSTGGTAS